MSPDWKSKVGSATSVEWPVGIGAKGNEGVSNNVSQTKGSIGYVEYAYALQEQNDLYEDGQQGWQGRRAYRRGFSGRQIEKVWVKEIKTSTASSLNITSAMAQ